jgi:hypothetical protein
MQTVVVLSFTLHCHLSAALHMPAAPLRMSDTVGPPAVTGPATTALWALMAERTSKPRGSALILPPAGKHIQLCLLLLCVGKHLWLLCRWVPRCQYIVKKKDIVLDSNCSSDSWQQVACITSLIPACPPACPAVRHCFHTMIFRLMHYHLHLLACLPA